MYADRTEELGEFQFNKLRTADASEELYLSSHPGYCLVDDEYMDLGLLPEDHFRYSNDFFNEFARKVDSDVEIGVLEERGTDYSREFLGDLANEVDHWIETVEGKARPTPQSAGELIDTLRSLSSGSIVTVSGEVNGLCVGQAGQIVEYVSDAYDLGLNVEKGITFPERPVERPNSGLRFTS